MITNLYCIRDVAAEDSGPIFHAKNNAVAVRNYQQMMKDTPYSGDYKLLLLGSYDSDRTLIVLLSLPEEVNLTISSEVISDEA